MWRGDACDDADDWSFEFVLGGEDFACRLVQVVVCPHVWMVVFVGCFHNRLIEDAARMAVWLCRCHCSRQCSALAKPLQQYSYGNGGDERARGV